MHSMISLYVSGGGAEKGRGNLGLLPGSLPRGKHKFLSETRMIYRGPGFLVRFGSSRHPLPSVSSADTQKDWEKETSCWRERGRNQIIWHWDKVWSCVNHSILSGFCPFLNKIFWSSSYPAEQCLGSGSGLDPDSIRSVDPDSESGSRFRRAKMTHRNRKKS